MTQALQSPYAVPVLQIVAAVAVLQIVNYPFLKEGAWRETNKPRLTRVSGN
jgi:hypothetical protein